MRVDELQEARKFGNDLTGVDPIVCFRSVRTDVELRIRHVERLILGNLHWLVSYGELGHAYLGRHLLAALGIDSRVLMAAPRDRHGTDVDAK